MHALVFEVWWDDFRSIAIRSYESMT